MVEKARSLYKGAPYKEIELTDAKADGEVVAIFAARPLYVGGLLGIVVRSLPLGDSQGGAALQTLRPLPSDGG